MSSYIALLVNTVIQICTYLQSFISGRTLNSYNHIPPSFTEDILLAKALNFSAANMHSVVECLGICTFAFL